MMKKLLLVAVVMCALTYGYAFAEESNDSSDFVLLSEAVPDAILEIRYYSTYNFVGDRITGYEAPVAMLTKEAAKALREVSDELTTKGYRLKIFDAYRPQRAVNHFSAWGQVTPKHNAFIDAIIASKLHIICTIRSKTEYAQIQNEKGKTEIKKIGLGLVQREGIDYEFTTVFDLNQDHSVSVSKDRTSLFDGQVFMITQETGKTLKEWLDTGIEIIDEKELQERKSSLYQSYLRLFQDTPQEAQRLAQEAIMSITDGRGSKDWTVQDLNNLENDVQKRINQAVHEELAEAV